MRRQTGAQALHLVETAHKCRSGCSDVASQTSLVRGVTSFEDRIDIGGIVCLRRDHIGGAVRHGRDRVDQKAVRGVNRLVAGAEIGVREIVQQFVRARAADDAVRIEPEGAPDGFAQRARGAFRVIFQMIGGGLVGLYGFWRRPERGLVRGTA